VPEPLPSTAMLSIAEERSAFAWLLPDAARATKKSVAQEPGMGAAEETAP